MISQHLYEAVMIWLIVNELFVIAMSEISVAVDRRDSRRD